MKRVLVVGGGGREHAILRALSRHGHTELLCAPGNAGIASDGVRCLDIEASAVAEIVSASREQSCDLVVVGPEAPLVEGLVDYLQEAGVVAFGPRAAAARIEGSKAYAKEIMRACGVPTPSHAVFLRREDAQRHLAQSSYPVVVKADALAAGKGVSVCHTPAQAHTALDVLFTERRYGDTPVVIEEFVDGQELSVLAVCDGERALALAPARDYKRIYDGDAGPNTGGMGSYCPVAGIDQKAADQLCELIHQPVVDELRARGTPYHGVLYAGLMMTADGPKVLEFNCRFGDPETQSVLVRLRSDLLELLERAARPGGLKGASCEWSSQSAVTVVLASAGYPESSSKGDPISGLDAIPGADVEILHASTKVSDSEIVTAGGRVLNVTGLGNTLGEAQTRAYEAVARVRFEGMQFRTDIATTTKATA
jgi:phosphoribosylamine---glycine ligase